MPYLEMSQELLGMVPKLPLPLAETLINRAWKDVRRQNIWSFQLYDGPLWVTPALITAGTCTPTLGLSTVTVDVAAAAAINAIVPPAPLVTKRQFRVAAGTIYNIWGWDGINTLTLDRAYGEVTPAASAYQILQVYYAAPYVDHRFFLSVRNMQQFIDLFLNKTRAMIDAMDPQRTWYYFPTDAVYYQQDQNPASGTYRYPLYELWGIPQSTFTYQLYGVREGLDFVNDTDSPPPAIGEDCIVELAKVYAFQWAEAHKGEMVKGGPDFKFLMGGALAEYRRLYKEYRRIDREKVNNWSFTRRISLYGKVMAYYSSISGTAYPGTALGG
jgi:hypothetical protein